MKYLFLIFTVVLLWFSNFNIANAQDKYGWFHKTLYSSDGWRIDLDFRWRHNRFGPDQKPPDELWLNVTPPESERDKHPRNVLSATLSAVNPEHYVREDFEELLWSVDHKRYTMLAKNPVHMYARPQRTRSGQAIGMKLEIRLRQPRESDWLHLKDSWTSQSGEHRGYFLLNPYVEASHQQDLCGPRHFSGG